MKKFLIFLLTAILLLIGQLTFAQSDLPLLRQHLNARVQSDGSFTFFYHNKLFDGFTQNISENGFCMEFLFENGIMQKEISYYPNGDLEREWTYTNGRRHGKFISYFVDGSKLAELNYINGILDGMQYGWNKDGTLRYEEQRLDGVILTRIEYENKDGLPMNPDNC